MGRSSQDVSAQLNKALFDKAREEGDAKGKVVPIPIVGSSLIGQFATPSYATGVSGPVIKTATPRLTVPTIAGDTNTPTLASGSHGDSGSEFYSYPAIARFTRVPHRIIEETETTGLVACHGSGGDMAIKDTGINYVEFQLGTGTAIKVRQPSWNEETEAEEWSVKIDPTTLSDGVYTLRAKVVPHNGVSRIQDYRFLINQNGTYDTNLALVRYVDSVNGDDSNDGLTPATAYKNFSAAYFGIRTADATAWDEGGWTVYFMPGAHFVHMSSDYCDATLTWVTLSAAPGYGPEDCYFSRLPGVTYSDNNPDLRIGRMHVRSMGMRNLADSSSRGQFQNFHNVDNQEYFFDGVVCRGESAANQQTKYPAPRGGMFRFDISSEGHNVYMVNSEFYWSDDTILHMELARNCYMHDAINGEPMSYGSGLMLNCTVRRMFRQDPDYIYGTSPPQQSNSSTGSHADLVQLQVDGDGNGLVWGCTFVDVAAQMLFIGKNDTNVPENFAIVNTVCEGSFPEPAGGSFNSKFERYAKHVVWLHFTLGQTMVFKCHLNESFYVNNCYFSKIAALAPNPQVAGTGCTITPTSAAGWGSWSNNWEGETVTQFPGTGIIGNGYANWNITPLNDENDDLRPPLSSPIYGQVTRMRGLTYDQAGLRRKAQTSPGGLAAADGG
jgi:hypothetical protein